jgi:hypothetical protein
MRTLTRFRMNPIHGLALAALACGFISGTMAGTAGTLAFVSPPAHVEPCSTTADPIACLIAESEEPPL